ncbi:uncharacterized protein PV07_09982 [Cladophialophora immunda]|uniref:Zn(2)-C6 fungal-type domain-containing protein n=1 Tax=Cladophialophora immunda TaxID=569365 RepID=A0A0D2CL17_9EURO|nr:uncharacterized protein PV07_09982 [Cladophialophora immunda]KIW24254.1 hypothetical protein PV07_09982 [Cladophialophora immunda]OQV09586.1 Fungal Zn2-Cys6 binuclear cluster domain-containing protein [Cladophialophora immunda]
MTALREASRSTKRQLQACTYCREKKVRCDGTRPCSKCQRDGVDCLFVGRQRRPINRAKSDKEELKQRMEMLEQRLFSLVQTKQNSAETSWGLSSSPSTNPLSYASAGQAQSATVLPSLSTCDLSDNTGASTTTFNNASLPSSNMTAPLCPVGASLETSAPERQTDTASSELGAATDIRISRATVLDPPQDRTDEPEAHHSGDTDPGMPLAFSRSPSLERTSVLAPAGIYSTNGLDDFEYPGLLSVLSIRSPPGLAWVRDQCGNDHFPAVADRLYLALQQRAVVMKPLVVETILEPDLTTALSYIHAFFEKSPESALVPLNRSEIESRVRRQSGADQSASIYDPCWHAIRNAVYAAGSRIVLSRLEYSSTFEDAHTTSKRYFDKALLVLPELLNASFDLEAIRSILLLSTYAMALPNASVGHILICAAMRLAQSLGLHRKFQPDCNEGSIEYTSRSWVFWSIYAVEKTMSFSFGLDSVVDDDTITCPFPMQGSPDSHLPLDFLLHAAKLAKILSTILYKLKPSRMSRCRTEELILLLNSLRARLEAWKMGLPESVIPGKRSSQFKAPTAWSASHVVYLRCGYYTAMLGIHSVLACPWTAHSLVPSAFARLKKHIDESSAMLADVSRDIITTSDTMDTNASTPDWQVLRLPIVAAVNVFVHVLGNPGAPTSSNDLALLDIAAGHLGHLDFVRVIDTSWPVVRDLANLARSTVKTARQNHTARNPDLHQPSARDVG